MLFTSLIINNWPWVLLGIVVISLFFFLLSLLEQPKKSDYAYIKRNCVMTESERTLFQLLNQAVGDKYHVFPQVHLPTILDHKIRNGQNWNGAFRHINQKSVDFVLCDKVTSSPILAIEYDDRSHEREERQDRDREVERIFLGADMPLLRIKYGPTTANELIQKIESSITFSLNTQK